MIRKCLMVAMVVAIGCVVAAPAQAGGSTGTKKVATIRVQNLTGGGLGVSTVQGNATNLASIAAFQAVGGQLLSAGQIGSFKVPAGASTLYGYTYAAGAFPAAAAPDATNSTSVGVTGVAGKTGYVNAAIVGGNLAMAGSATKF